jgi:hypothetical protein
LISSLLIAVNNDSLSFLILSTINWDDLVVVWINKLSINELEYLEPLWVGAPDLHVVGSTCRLDIKWLVVQSGSDGLWLLMEVPLLCISSILSLDDHVSVVNQVKISSTWQCRDDVEISFDIESELFIQLSLLWLRVLVNIDNLPLLSEILVSVVYHHISLLLIWSLFLILDFKNLSSLVDNESSLSSEDLPPSWIGSSTSYIGWSSISLNIKRVMFPLLRLDSLRYSIEEPLLA